MKRCTKISDSLLSGQPLSDGDRDHLAACADCARLAAMARLVTSIATAAEVGPGFTSRVIAGARERLAARRRQRIVGFGLAAVVAAAATVLIVSSQRGGGRRADPPVAVRPAGDLPGVDEPAAPDDGITDDELRELVGGATMTRALAPSADWDHIETPVRNYHAVLRLGGQP